MKTKTKAETEFIMRACERANAMGGQVLNYCEKTGRVVVMFDDDVYLYEVHKEQYRHVPGRALLSLNRRDMSEADFETFCAGLV